MAKTKYVYFFGDGDAEGDESMRAELGGKGANLAQMAKAPLSLPVPSGFTISTDVCQEFYKLGRKYPASLNAEVEKYLAKLAGSKPIGGTSCSDMISVLKKNTFICEYFYKSTFSYALKELKNGGCALIFHANNHYVSILDISSNGKKVLVSNSYGTFDNIPTKWVKVSFMKKKFSPKWDESLIVRLNYKLSDSTKDSISSYYHSFGTGWLKHSTSQSIGRI